MQRIKNSWELAKVSWSVLRSDKTLAVFPILSAVASLILVGIFAGLIAATGVNDSGSNSGLKGIGYVFIVAGYIALAFVSTYFLAALVHAANEALEGRRAALGESFAAANTKLHRILPWALVQATVSIVIQALEQRGFLGQIVASLIGAAWAVVTFLTVPIIMLEDLGPIAALKRSGHLLRESWGENIAAQFGFSIFGLIGSLPAILVSRSAGSTMPLPPVAASFGSGALSSTPLAGTACRSPFRRSFAVTSWPLATMPRMMVVASTLAIRPMPMNFHGNLRIVMVPPYAACLWMSPSSRWTMRSAR